VADIVLQKLLIPNKPLLCIPGNHDPFEIVEIFDEFGINLHNRVRNFNGLPIIGWGGAMTPFNTLFEPSEEETNEVLTEITKDVSGRWILVTHAPPKGTKLDRVKDAQHVGSDAVANIIKIKKPLLAISAHIHENKGTDKIGGTTVFYPGPAFDGCYGVVTIDAGRVRCEMKRVKMAAPKKKKGKK
jgi:Icc-related predicted phosphoesterase